MKQITWRALAEELLASADIQINGTRPWDIKLYNEKLFERVFKYYSLGLGEAYVEHWWDCEQIDEFFFRILSANIDQQILNNKRFLPALMWLKLRSLNSFLFNQQREAKSLEVGRKHYDIGNDLYRYMLDKNLNYTCGYWQDSNNLDDAQIAKMELICQKLHLKPGMRLLDIGCGFGTFAKYAAQHYGIQAVGITISKQQQLLGVEICKGFPVEIRFLDYRNINESFDRIVSLGMFEHVGYKNYSTYMSKAAQCLDKDGIFLLHTIGSNVSSTEIDPWINRYIFPNSLLPSIAQIGKAIEPYFVMEDWHNFGPDYTKTLRAWHDNFTANLSKLDKKYDEKFQRMWSYYLLSSAGGFKAKTNQLWQIALTKASRMERYVSIR